MIDTLADLFILRGIPGHIRSDNGSEFIATAVKDCDVAPSFYPAAIGLWRSVWPSWAVVAAVRGAEPSVERSAADRRCAA